MSTDPLDVHPPSHLAAVGADGQPEKQPQTLLDGLRAQHAKVAAATSVKVVISGYKRPQLAAEYRLLPPEEAKKLGEQINAEFDSDGDRMLYAALDVLVDSVVRFHARATPADEFAPLLDPHDPVTNWGVLAELIGQPADSARDAVVGVFMGNANAAVAHSQRVQTWMNDTSLGVDREFLGEA